MTIPIFIPTKDRTKLQYTWNVLPKELQKHTQLVCPEYEADEHIKQNRNILVHPDEADLVCKVRQWLIENYGPKLVMLDDDLKFFRRLENTWKLTKCSDQDIIELFIKLEDKIDPNNSPFYPMVGIGMRQGNHNVYPETERENVRICNAYAIYTPILLKHDIRFDWIPIMEDFHVALSLLEHGYKTLSIESPVFNHYGYGSNSPGGASHYRNFERQRECAYKMEQKHFPYVKVVEKHIKHWWHGFPIDEDGKVWRHDIRVSWKKAYEEGSRNKTLFGEYYNAPRYR